MDIEKSSDFLGFSTCSASTLKKLEKVEKTWKSRNVAKPLYCRHVFEITAISLDVFSTFLGQLRINYLLLMNSRVRPSRRTAKKGRWRVIWTINFCCYFKRIWTSWQKHEKNRSEHMSFISQSSIRGAETHARASRPLRTPQPAHNYFWDREG